VISFAVGDYLVRSLDPNEADIIQSLAERAFDYFEMVYGEPPPADFGATFAESAPVIQTPANLVALGIFEGRHNLIGLIHCAKDLPEAGTWYVGLMLIERTMRNKGIGRKAHQAFASFAKRSGAERLKLSVVDENTQGRKFWESLQYIPTAALPETGFGRKRQTRTEFTLALEKF
jgi:RimJ/RimL family protein N-acetyltransferase